MKPFVEKRFAIPGRCAFVMSLDIARRTQQMIAAEHELSGFYEGRYSLFVAALLRPGDVVVDVGAHVGYYTLLAASVVGNAGHVFSFEPAYDNAAFLRRNVELNQFTNVSLTESLVGNRDGEAVLHYNSDNDGGHAVWDIRNVEENVKSRIDARTLRVPMTTLDTCLTASAAERIRLIKIDAEGSEGAVLQGASHLLRSPGVDCIMWERNASALAACGTSETEIRLFAQAAGYETFAFVNEKLSWIRPGEVASPGQEINLFFLHKSFVDGGRRNTSP